MAHKRSPNTKTLNLRVPPDFVHRLDEMMAESPLAARGLGRSSLVRQIVDLELSRYYLSPYVAVASSRFLFISAKGDLWIVERDDLRPNIDLDIVPWEIRLEPDRVDTLGRSSSWESIWMLNHFSLWDRDQILAEGSDWGEKPQRRVELECEVPANYVLGREALLCLRGYCRFRAGPRLQGTDYFDRASFSFQVPTWNAEFLVVVDRALYGNDAQLLGRQPQVVLELLNREHVAFRGTRFAQSLPGASGRLERSGYFSASDSPSDESGVPGNFEGSIAMMKERLDGVIERHAKISNPTTRTDATAEAARHCREELNSLAPEELMFSHVKVPWVSTLVMFSFKWDQPWREPHARARD